MATDRRMNPPVRDMASDSGVRNFQILNSDATPSAVDQKFPELQTLKESSSLQSN